MMPCVDPKAFDRDYCPATNPYWLPKEPPSSEFSEEHRAMMRQRFADLIKELKAAPEACTPRSCPRKYGQECPREDRRWCRSSDELAERGFIKAQQKPSLGEDSDPCLGPF